MLTRLIFIGALLCARSGNAEPPPQPPCGTGVVVPPYPELTDAPTVKSWTEAELGRDWKPPACTGWVEPGFSSLTATVAHFRFSGGSDGLLRRIGAISGRAGIRYWSTTHRKWQTLVVSAHALASQKAVQSRPDFTPGELKQGAVLYFEQADNLTGKAIYRMRLTEVSADRMVFDVENVSIMRYYLVTLFHPGEVQSIYYLDREADDVWRYYGLARIGRNASRLAAGHPASSINRAVAFYRSLVGVPTDSEPPAAR